MRHNPDRDLTQPSHFADLLSQVSDDRASLAHLLRRTGFGPTAAEVDAATSQGFSATVERLVDFTGPDPADAEPMPSFASYTPLGARGLTADQRHALQLQHQADAARLISWWVARMAATAHPLREKLTWFWHGHFATSIQKVQRADFMATQNEVFRAQGAANFEALTQAVAKDPAMLIWLDAATNLKAHPNENFARELMELFTLGIGNYTEQDVKEAARAFTGWRLNRASASFTLSRQQHDDGVKTVLGQTGPWTGEDVIHILTNQPASARWIVARLWSHFAFPVDPTDPIVSELVPPFAQTHDIKQLMQAILLHPAFLSDTARAGLVKQPIEWVVGSARVLGLPAGDQRFAAGLRALGQLPFAPPNVGGWPQNAYWLTTASSLARLRLAAGMVNAAGAPVNLLSATAPAARTDAVGQLLSISPWSATTASALAEVASNPKALLTLALVSPEYTLA